MGKTTINGKQAVVPLCSGWYVGQQARDEAPSHQPERCTAMMHHDANLVRKNKDNNQFASIPGMFYT